MTTHSTRTTATPTPVPPSQWSGILRNDPEFQRFAATRSGFPGGQFSNSAAAEFIRTTCRVTTCRDLNTDTTAARQFARLRTEFDAWRGRIAARR